MPLSLLCFKLSPVVYAVWQPQFCVSSCLKILLVWKTFWSFSIISKMLFSLEWLREKFHLIWNSGVLRDLIYVRAFHDFLFVMIKGKGLFIQPAYFECQILYLKKHCLSWGRELWNKDGDVQLSKKCSLLVETSTDVTDWNSLMNSVLAVCTLKP